MAQLKLSLLGPFTVTLEDRPVAFAYDKVRALLAYLAVGSAAPQHREVVADLLWAGYPEPSARQSLSQALSTLRGALADRDADTPFLLVTPRDLQFNAAGDAWLDVDELTDHLDAVQSHPHAALHTCDACVAHLEAAAALYRGDFLADLLVEDSAPFEEWALLKRENLRRTILDALAQLAEAYLQRGAAEAALRCARRQLELDDWREVAHRQVMRALVLSGQRTAAIAHYEACRQALATGLGVEPEAATLELAHLLKSNTLIVDTPFPDAGSGPGPDLIGRAVGNYLVVERLGQGGMAEVYKAYHTRLGRYVALKFIRPELLQPAALHAFEQEARTLAQLNHPNVIQVYDYGELALSETPRRDALPPRPYLVMEYVAGQTLKAWLPEGTALPLDQAWPILQQVSVALDYAHEHGVIHRDIKPGNIMLTPDGHALLGDFGISKLLRPGEDAAYTVATTGTPAYMAPEQVDSSLGPISAATDVYALGLITYEMLTGQRPFQADSLLAEMVQRVQKDPTPPSRYRPDIPPAVEQVLLRVLARDPQARYARAGAFARALAAAAPQLLLEHPSAHVPAWWPQLAATLEPTPGPAPFKGLQHFAVADAEWFFGREALVTRLVRQVMPAAPHDRRAGQAAFLAIVGASGSGKSSLVRAGLVAALLREGAVTAHVLTPTAHPLEALALTLTRDSESVTAAATLMDDMARDPRSLRLYLQRQEAGSKKQEARSREQEPAVPPSQSPVPNPQSPIPMLLVIDQFEEVFTLCRDAEARHGFVANLLAAAGAAAPGKEQDAAAFVVITLRADFYEHCAQYPELREALGRYQVYIGPMTADGLRHAIEEPARCGGWEFEPGLVDLLLRDVGAEAGHQPEPGALPLLSHALLETWHRRRERTLTLGGYAEAGGVRGAIAKTAEAVYQGLDAEQQAIARNIFLRLTELGEGTQDTRRRPGLAEVRSCHADGAAVDRVLARLADARLITTEQEAVQVAHEALIREWPTLRGWLEEDREGLRVHRHLTEAAQAWAQLGRDPGELYRGARLAQAAEWAAVHSTALNTLEREFLATAQAEAEREEAEREAQRQRELEAAQRLAEAEKRRAEEGQAAARQLRRRARFLAAAVAGVLVIAIVAVLLWNRARKAERDALIQASIGLASQAMLELQGATPERSVLLALEALENYPYTWQAERALGQTVLDYRLCLILPHDKPVYRALWSPDGSRIVTVSKDTAAKIWDAATGELLLTLLGHDYNWWSAQWSPTGEFIALGDLGGAASVWNVTTGEKQFDLIGHHPGDMINTIEWSPDKTRILTSCDDGTAKIWDATTGAELFTLSGHKDFVQIATWKPSGDAILTASADGTARIWDAATGKELFTLRHTDKVWWASWSPDGMRVATTGDGYLKVWNASTGANIFALRPGVYVSRPTWAPSGKRIVTRGSTEGTAQVWDMAPSSPTYGEQLFTLAGHRDSILNMAWSSDSTRIATAGQDGRVKIWDATAGAELLTLFGHKNGVYYVAWSPSNDRLLTASLDGTAKVWDVASGPELFTLYEHTVSLNSDSFEAFVNAASWSPSGDRLVTASEDGTARVWDGVTGKEFLTMTLPVSGGATWAEWSHSGEQIVTSDCQRFVKVWDATNGEVKLRITTGHGDYITRVIWSPDDKRIATSSRDGRVEVRDAITGKLLVTLQGHKDIVPSVAWSPSGDRIATASADQTAKVWDATTGDELLTLSGFDSIVAAVLWSTDGTRLVTHSDDGVGRVWDAATGKELMAFTGHTYTVSNMSWSPKGDRLVTGSMDGTARVWDMNTGVELVSYSLRAPIFDVDWSPNGTSIVVVGQQSLAQVFPAWQTPQELIDYAKECCVVRELTDKERETFGLPLK